MHPLFTATVKTAFLLHFVQEKSDAPERWGNLPKVTQRVSSEVRISPRAVSPQAALLQLAPSSPSTLPHPSPSFPFPRPPRPTHLSLPPGGGDRATWWGREAAAAQCPGGCPAWVVLSCAAPRSVPSLRALRSPPAAPGQEVHPIAGPPHKGGPARQSQCAGGQTMDSERGRLVPALGSWRSGARP